MKNLIKNIFTGLVFFSSLVIISRTDASTAFLSVIPGSASTAVEVTGATETNISPELALAMPDSVPDLPFPFQDNPRDPLVKTDESPLFLRQPSNIKKVIEYDPERNEYIFREKIGNLDYSRPRSMTREEYRQHEFRQSTRDYWRQRSKADQTGGERGFAPSFNLGGEAFDKVFGTNVINIVPQGTAELVFGVNTSRIDNPNISERLRKSTTFDFQEKIQMNVTGNIGDKMKLGVNYNTEATFEFENKTKLEYTGKEDEIIKKIEAGNVNLPLTGSLITGSQSLFGIKTELQFGKLNVTTVLSQQKGQSSVIEVKGGAQINEFEVRADQYEANRHFFLAHYFRDNFESALEMLPVINSSVQITRIEVWVTNKSNNIESPRNIVAFLDLGEGGEKKYNDLPLFSSNGEIRPSNESNKLYQAVTTGGYNVRDITQVTNVLAPLSSSNFVGGQDFEKIENARKLTEREYTLNPRLGYISLNSGLNADEVLAVAYEYTLGGKTYRVGELSSSGVTAPEALVVKLLKGTNLTPNLPNWDLMMKNVYALGAFQVNSKDFELNIMYQDDKSGNAVNFIPEKELSKDILLRTMQLDRLNTNLDPYPDGVFDYIEGITIISSNGRVIFPVLEPFGSNLERYLAKNVPAADLEKLRDKYVFNELYRNTQTSARQVSEKNKFLMQGTYQSSSSSEIPLNAMNVPQGSVVVTAGGRQLTENVDYTVDYTLGRVRIINQGLMESGTPIRVSLESQSLFNIQTKTLMGTHMNYRFSENFNVGGTILHLRERPLTRKVNIGDEPIANTIWGLNTSYRTESQFLTTLVDKIPLIQTKEKSSISFTGEFAQLIPGNSRAISKSGIAYIDDFEGSETYIDLKSFPSWVLASVPQGQENRFPNAHLVNDRRQGYNRAKLAWYVIDPLFLRNTSNTPSNIKGNKAEQTNHFVREVSELEIFKNKETPSGLPTNIPVLNLAYYPYLRGPYNYDAESILPNGRLNNPARRFGGIMREVLTNDFEAANIEYIEFWLMDPFVYDSTNLHRGGDLFLNLGDVSEDVLRDGRKAFENGMPVDGDRSKVDSTAWGLVPKAQSLVNAFDNDPNNRVKQDVGLDGLGDAEEREFFREYLDILKDKLDPDVYKIFEDDPSNDNFRYYRSSYYDQNQAGILERYKRFNGMQNNSPASQDASQTFAESGTSLPNSEDINRDNTLSENENYFQYRVRLSREEMEVGRNYIIDKVTAKVKDNEVPVDWYQFRIPVQGYEQAIGSIQDFKSIRFFRMFLNGFEDSVILRFAKLELIRGEWRKYNLSFASGGEYVTSPEANDVSFEISAVNIERNAGKEPVNYVLPPGFDREIDPSNPQLRQLNEQSMVLKIRDLSNGDARAAYKNTILDMRQYKRLKMEVHGERIPGTNLEDKELTVFIRLGSDYKNNYYEYEVPVKLTPHRSNYSNTDLGDRAIVWPEENRIDIALDDFMRAKQARNDEMRRAGTNVSMSTVYEYFIGNRKFTVCGNPNLSNVRTVMVGVRFPQHPDRVGEMRSAEIWVNELRLTDFDQDGGWAANALMTAKLADFATLSLSGNISTPGFGSIEKKVQERSKEEIIQYDVSSNVELGKFFPEKAQVSIPMYVGYSESFVNPEYNPLDPDIPLKAALANAENKEEADRIKDIAQDYTQRKSLNFTNVKVNRRSQKPKLYDPANFAVSYAYSQTYAHNVKTEYNEQRRYRGAFTYNYNTRPKVVEPFRQSKMLKSNYLRLIRDFNFYYSPSNLSFRTDISRNYNEVKIRNLNNPNLLIDPTVNKDFFWNRYYDMKFDLTRGLKFDFSANNISRIDEPEGIVNKYMKDEYQLWKDSVWRNIHDFGRTTQYSHNMNLSYTVPINKIPMFDWTSLSTRYSASYGWDVAPILPASIMEGGSIGNTIRNSNTTQINAQLNLNTLYNKSAFLKQINQSAQRRPNQQKEKRYRQVSFERPRTFLRAGQPRSIVHKLGTENVTVKVFDSSGTEIQGQTTVVNENRVNFTAQEDYTGVRILVEGQKELGENPLKILAEGAGRFLLGVKNASVSYSQTEGTLLPGYMPNSRLLGSDTHDGMFAPGVPFIMGWQDKQFARKAAANGMLSSSPYLSNPYMMTYNNTLNARSNIEPLPGFKIELTGLRFYSRNETSYYIAAMDGTFPDSTRNLLYSGNYTISFLSIGSAFEKISSDDQYSSPTYETFKRNRMIIASRLANERMQKDPFYNPTLRDSAGRVIEGFDGYNLNSQEVLIPAFLAAYGNRDPNKVSMQTFQSFLAMMPNWRVSYDGLTRIEFLKKRFKTVNINHSYRSTYSIGNYMSNAAFFDNIQDGLSFARDLQMNFMPEFEITSISINEQFGPLVNIDMTWQNNLTTRFELRKSRTINLSLVNSQLTEIGSNEVVIGGGYRFNEVPLIFVAGGGQQTIKSDLNLRADLSIRDNKTLVRRLSEDTPLPAQGQRVFKINISADYMLSDRFNLRMFYDRIVNNPFVSLSYRTANTNVGFSVRFTLVQ